MGNQVWQEPKLDPINIVCTTDQNYVSHSCVMLSSLIANNPGAPLHIYLITDHADSEEFCRLKQHLAHLEVPYSVFAIDRQLLANAPVTHHISVATYFRLLIPYLLPASVEKALFIDSDVVVRKSILDLWTIDLAGYSHAATIAAGMDCYPATLGLGEDSLYFNAGILLINLNFWRDHRVFERGCELIEQQREKLQWWDQDVLNLLLQGTWKPIDLTWNAQPFVYEFSPERHAEVRARYEQFQYQQAQTDPAIVHYVGGGSAKPWHFYCNHPFKDDYRQVLQTTPWRNAPLLGQPNLVAKMRFQLGLGSKVRNLLRFSST